MKRRQLLIIMATALLTTGCGSLNGNNENSTVSEADTAISEETKAEAESEPEAEAEPSEEPKTKYELAEPYLGLFTT